MDLCPRLIMDISEALMLLIKTKDLAEGHKVNTVVTSLSHPVFLISIDVIEEGSMELG
jgi:hypothetical protein